MTSSACTSSWPVVFFNPARSCKGWMSMAVDFAFRCATKLMNHHKLTWAEQKVRQPQRCRVKGQTCSTCFPDSPAKHGPPRDPPRVLTTAAAPWGMSMAVDFAFRCATKLMNHHKLTWAEQKVRQPQRCRVKGQTYIYIDRLYIILY